MDAGLAPILPDIGEFSRAIQQALAPAFLLSAIGALLNVMTGRLSRIVDRGRSLVEARDSEREGLERRRHLTSVAITFTTIAALLVSMVVAGLFVEVVLQAPMKWVISTFLAAAMVTLMVGLSFFLREVHLAMRTVRLFSPNVLPSAKPRAPSSDRRARYIESPHIVPHR